MQEIITIDEKNPNLATVTYKTETYDLDALEAELAGLDEKIALCYEVMTAKQEEKGRYESRKDELPALIAKLKASGAKTTAEKFLLAEEVIKP